MSAGITSERALIDAAEQQGLLPPEARAAWRDEAGSSWIVIVLTFLGAQLVVLPFLGFLAKGSSFSFSKMTSPICFGEDTFKSGSPASSRTCFSFSYI